MNRTSVIGSPDVTGNYYRSGAQKGENAEETKSYREQILEKMEEMMKNIKNGTIQPKFRIGAQEFTVKEWEKFLEKFDAAEEVMREEVEAQIEEVKQLAEEEAARRAAMFGIPEPAKMTDEPEAVPTRTGVSKPETETVTDVSETDVKETDAEESAVKDAAALLTDEITKCSYPTDDPKKKHWYITAYGQDGISCKEAYFDGTRWINKDLWSFSYTEKGQYEKVMTFLQRFLQDENLRFAAQENFWKDFLAGEIDEDEFVSFYEIAKDGIPEYIYEKPALVQDGGQRHPENEEAEIETKLVTKPDGSTVLQIKTKYGVTELEITQAQKFGLLLDMGRAPSAKNSDYANR